MAGRRRRLDGAAPARPLRHAQNKYSLYDRSADAELIPALSISASSLLPYFPLGLRPAHRQVPAGTSRARGFPAGVEPGKLLDADFDRIEALAAYAERARHRHPRRRDRRPAGAAVRRLGDRRRHRGEQVRANVRAASGIRPSRSSPSSTSSPLRQADVAGFEAGRRSPSGCAATRRQEHLYGDLMRSMADDWEPGPGPRDLREAGRTSRRARWSSCGCSPGCSGSCCTGRAPELVPYYPCLGGTEPPRRPGRHVRRCSPTHVVGAADALKVAPQTNEPGRSTALVVGVFAAVAVSGLSKVRLLERVRAPVSTCSSTGIGSRATTGPRSRRTRRWRCRDCCRGRVRPECVQIVDGAAATCRRSMPPATKERCGCGRSSGRGSSNGTSGWQGALQMARRSGRPSTAPARRTGSTIGSRRRLSGRRSRSSGSRSPGSTGRATSRARVDDRSAGRAVRIRLRGWRWRPPRPGPRPGPCWPDTSRRPARRDRRGRRPRGARHGSRLRSVVRS